MSVDDPILTLEDIVVEYEDEPLINQVLPQSVLDRFDLTEEPIRAVDGVDLDVGENDVIALVGESGSGKTTLGKTAVALQEPTEGTVEYRGHDVWDVKNGVGDGDIFFEEIRKSLQIVHQDPGAALNPYRSILSSLSQPLKRWAPELSSADRRERILSLLRESGLTPAKEYQDRYPHELSGGEQQRVTLLRAMMTEPDVILADEPVSALDNSLRVEIMDLMIELQEMFETSYIFISHNLEHARYIANKCDGRIAIMYLGEIVEIGPAEEVIRDPQHPYTKILKWATLPTHPDRAREALEEELPLRSVEIPDLVNKPSGCQFHTRCPYAREACVAQDPSLEPRGGERPVSCFRNDETHEYWDSEPLDEEEKDEAEVSM